MKIPFRGGYLVDKTRNLKYITFCKPLNGGYWLNTHSSTTNKIELMKQIGEYFGTEVTFDIEEKDDNEPTATSSAHEIRHSNNMVATGRAKYSLNGGEPQNKRRTVHSVVSLYMKLHPRVTWREMLDVFPKELQGSYGVINTVESIQYRIKKDSMTRNVTSSTLQVDLRPSMGLYLRSVINGVISSTNSENMSKINSVG